MKNIASTWAEKDQQEQREIHSTTQQRKFSKPHFYK